MREFFYSEEACLPSMPFNNIDFQPWKRWPITGQACQIYVVVMGSIAVKVNVGRGRDFKMSQLGPMHRHSFDFTALYMIPPSSKIDRGCSIGTVASDHSAP